MVEEGVYSVLYGQKSYNVELIRNSSAKKYTVNTYKSSYDVEIIDAETKYLRSRDKNRLAFDAQAIVSPMPGKVVKILVEEGDEVEEGQTAIVLSAMKMESEFKAGKNARVLKVHVNEGDAVDGQQILISLE
jgi:biotin carboxyl carrier protein